jgi:hypothetical protein
MADWRSDDREMLARILSAEVGNQGSAGLPAQAPAPSAFSGVAAAGPGWTDVIGPDGKVVRREGTRAWRNNNPGNIEYGDFATSRGAIGTDGRFAVFPSYEAGRAAKESLLFESPSYQNRTIASAINRYAPPVENDTQNYIGQITSALGVSPDTRLSELSPQQRIAMLDAMQKVEGFSVGTTSNTGATAMSPTTMTQGLPAPMPQEQQQPGGLRGLLSDPDFYDRLAIGLGGLTMNPNQQLMQMSADRIAGRAQTRQDTAATNRTVEYLRSQGRDDLADAVASGSLGGRDAAAILFQPKDPTKGVSVGDRIVNPITGEVIYEPTGGPAFDAEKVQDARKEFTSLPQVKAFADQTTAYGRVISSIDDPSPAGDLALIFNYMKVLDPGSVVREGEFATAQNAGSVDDRTRGLYNRIMSGERLSERQRADFADRATRLYSGAEQQYQSIAEQYGSFAQAAGLPADQVIPDYSFVGNRYQTPSIYRVPPTPPGVTQQDWEQSWQNMTDAQRQTFLNTPTTP